VKLNAHYNLRALAGTHAFLSPSKPAWLNYDEDHLNRVFHATQAAARGTRLHDLARQCIELGVRLPDSPTTLNQYVNDAIGFKMYTEWLLYYSENCYGHCDAIVLRNGVLRIHDLKTGVTESDMRQLLIYAALFCLEYQTHPKSIKIELRIYQNDQVKVLEPEVGDIIQIMEKIKFFDKHVSDLRSEVQS